MTVLLGAAAAVSLAFSTYLGGPKTDDCDGIAVDAAHDIYLACHIYSEEYPDQSFEIIKLATDGQAIRYRTRVGVGNASFIAVDRDGSAYVAGWTSAPDFPVTRGASFAGGERDIVVVKLDPRGAVDWSIFLGGSKDDVPGEIVLDASGNAYVVGTTDSADFPVSTGAFQSRYGGERDAFITKLSPSGAKLYSTYLGGSGSEERLAGVTVSADGSAYVAGTTHSKDFPMRQPMQARLMGDSDAFIAALEPDGSKLRFATYFGGGATEVSRHIAIDGDGNLFVAGRTMSEDFPTTPGAFQRAHAGGAALFVTKLDPRRRELIYSTLLTERGTAPKPVDWRKEWGVGHVAGLAIDAAGRASIVGGTELSDFPLVSPIQAALRGSSDGFVVQLNPAGSQIAFSTYFGGSDVDDFEDVALDAAGNLYLTGLTRSLDFPLANPLQSDFSGRDYDIVVLKLTVGAYNRR